MPKRPPPSRPPPVRPPEEGEPPSALIVEVQRLKAQIQDLDAENSRLRKGKSEMSRLARRTMEDEISDLKREIEQLKGDISSMRQSEERIRGKCAKLELGMGDAAILQGENDELNKQLEALQREVNILKATNAKQGQDLKAVPSNLKKCREDKKRIQRDMQASIDTMKTQNKDLERHMNSLSGELAECRTENEAKKGEIQELQDQNEALERTIVISAESCRQALEGKRRPRASAPPPVGEGSKKRRKQKKTKKRRRRKQANKIIKNI